LSSVFSEFFGEDGINVWCKNGEGCYPIGKILSKKDFNKKEGNRKRKPKRLDTIRGLGIYIFMYTISKILTTR
jgi:hypothetical protein